jgi:hypothetical protein
LQRTDAGNRRSNSDSVAGMTKKLDEIRHDGRFWVMETKFRIGQTNILIQPSTEYAPSGDLDDSLLHPTGLSKSAADVAQRIKEKQVELVDAVGGLAKDVDRQLSELVKSTKLTEITLELSLSLSAETSIWFVKSSGEGAVKVVLKWERSGWSAIDSCL